LTLAKEFPNEVLPLMETRYGVGSDKLRLCGTSKMIRPVVPKTSVADTTDPLTVGPAPLVTGERLTLVFAAKSAPEGKPLAIAITEVMPGWAVEGVTVALKVTATATAADAKVPSERLSKQQSVIRNDVQRTLELVGQPDENGIRTPRETQSTVS
jgi:hypothetical protein